MNNKKDEEVKNYHTYESTFKFLYNSGFRSIFIILSLIAIYLSFKINKGFNFGSFMVAFLFPPVYIIYVLAIYGSKFITKQF